MKMIKVTTTTDSEVWINTDAIQCVLSVPDAKSRKDGIQTRICDRDSSGDGYWLVHESVEEILLQIQEGGAE